MADVKVNGASVDQTNLPYTFPVTSKTFESFVKLYFGNDDPYRRLGISQTYLAVGVDRDTPLKDFVENIYQKLAARFPPNEIQRLFFFSFLFFSFFFNSFSKNPY
jgi:hypothetical protein